MAAGRHYTGAVAESFTSDPQAGGRERTLGLAWTFEILDPIPIDTPPPTRLHFLILLQQFHQLTPGIQIYEPVGPFLFKSS